MKTRTLGQPPVYGKVFPPSKSYPGPQGSQKIPRKVAGQAGVWADLPSHAAAHSWTEIRCFHTQRGPPSGPSFSAARQTPPRGHSFQLRADRCRRCQLLQRGQKKNSDEVAQAFQKIYKRSPLKWPQILQVDPGREFMGAVTQEMENHKTYIRRGRTEIHRDQAIVERFNRTLAERLFGYQYAVEMHLPSDQRSTAWVKRLPEVFRL